MTFKHPVIPDYMSMNTLTQTTCLCTFLAEYLTQISV